MANIPDDEKWRNFFDSYRDLPELWDFKRFKYRGNRDRFFDKLLDTYQEIHENATIDDLKKRLANIRRCYYREMDKMISEKKKGRTYESTLWYFDLLKFLKDPELREKQERMKNGPIEGNEDGPPSMGCIPDNPAWEIFFDFYRGLPELWDYRSILYKDKRKRNQSFARLLDIYRMICTDATFEDLKKRVQNIKRCYRREAIKKEEFEKSGHPSYVPNLWYFEYVDFLSYPDAQTDLQEVQQSRLVEVDEYGQVTVNEPRKASSEYRHTRPALTYEEAKKRLQSYLENRLKEAAKKAANRQKRRKLAPQISADENDSFDGEDYANLEDDDYTPRKKTSKLISMGKKTPKKSPYLIPFASQEQPQDEAAAYADSWAASFRNLSDMQKIYAKKA